MKKGLFLLLFFLCFWINIRTIKAANFQSVINGEWESWSQILTDDGEDKPEETAVFNGHEITYYSAHGEVWTADIISVTLEEEGYFLLIEGDDGFRYSYQYKKDERGEVLWYFEGWEKNSDYFYGTVSLSKKSTNSDVQSGVNVWTNSVSLQSENDIFKAALNESEENIWNECIPFQSTPKELYIRIYANSEEYGIYPLGVNQEIRIGETNICKIEDGTCRMIEANCPKQICVSEGRIQKEGETIVCLPNKVIISIVSDDETSNECEIDAVVH